MLHKKAPLSNPMPSNNYSMDYSLSSCGNLFIRHAKIYREMQWLYRAGSRPQILNQKNCIIPRSMELKQNTGPEECAYILKSHPISTKP